MIQMFNVMCILAMLAAVPLQAAAQAFPTRPIRLIIAYAPGGGTDILARSVAQAMSEDLGQPVVVENKPGAGSQVATDLVAKAPADGYTLLMATTAHAINPALYQKLPYDSIGDFLPVSQVATLPLIVLVSPTIPVSNFSELIALAKQKPGALNHATVTSSLPHLAGELLKTMAGIDFVTVGYKGAAPAYPDLISGRVQFMIDALSAGLVQVKSGKAKGVAVTSARRAPAAPEIPTVAESGLPGFAAEAWYGIVAPAGTPAAAVARLNAAIRKAVALPALQEQLKNQGYNLTVNTPDEYGAFIKAEVTKWGAAVRQAGITPQ